MTASLTVLGVTCLPTIGRQHAGTVHATGRVAQLHVMACDDGTTASTRWSVWLADAWGTLALGLGATLAEAEADLERAFARLEERYRNARGALDAAKPKERAA